MENVPQAGEVQETTPQDGTDSEEQGLNLDELFSEDTTEEQGEGGQTDKSVEMRLERIEKGLSRYFSDQGRKKAEPQATQPRQAASQVSPVIKNLYFKANPEAKHIWDMVEAEAKLLGKDPFELYESSSYLKGEAKAKADEAEAKDKDGKKVSKPSGKISGTGNAGDLSDADRALLARKPGLMEKYLKSNR